MKNRRQITGVYGIKSDPILNDFFVYRVRYYGIPDILYKCDVVLFGDNTLKYTEESTRE